VRLANAADRILEAPGVDPGDAEPVGHAVARLIAVGNRQLEKGLHAGEIGRRSRLIRELSVAYSESRKVKAVRGSPWDGSVALRGQVSARALLELGGEALDPAVHGPVVNLGPSVGEHALARGRGS
jgi:hypothetical protein